MDAFVTSWRVEGGARASFGGAKKTPAQLEEEALSAKKFGALGYFKTLLRVATVPVGRTSSAFLVDVAAAKELADAFLSSGTMLSAEAWYNSEIMDATSLVREVDYTTRPYSAGRPAPRRTARGVGEGEAPDEDEDVGGAEERAKHGYDNPAVKPLYQSLMHVWASDGTHMAWATITAVRTAIRTVLGHELPAESTLYKYMATERKLYEMDRALLGINAAAYKAGNWS